MRELSLPQNLVGNWIWLSEPSAEINKYCYFRYDLNLSETPRTAELWLAAHNTVHLFINGRHIYFGRGSQSAEKTYVHNLDLSYYLQPGNNLIGISVHNSSLPQYATYRHKQGGLWCQLDVNGQTILSTDKRWFVQSADCLHSPNLRCSSKNGFCEQLDFNKVSKSWVKTSDFLIDNWQRPDIVIPIESYRERLCDQVICNMICEEHFPESIAGTGSFTHKDYSTAVEYSELMTRAGTYIAESFLYVESGGKVAYNLYCDTNYKFFVNGKLSKQNVTVDAENGMTQEECFYHGGVLQDFGNSYGTIDLLPGWNRLTLLQALHTSSYGFTLNLDADPTHLTLMRQPNHDAMPGWRLFGPLQMPLSRATGSTHLPEDQGASYLGIKTLDPSAHYQAIHFNPDTDNTVQNPQEFELKHRQYVILDFHQAYYALPQFAMTGSPGDIVDIFLGEELVDGIVPAISKNRVRSVETVTLDGKINPWIDFNPKGFRYIMIVGREVKNRLTVHTCSIKNVHYEYQEEGLFESSDVLLNKIWQNSLNTIDATLNFNYMDGAGRENTQYIADAYIQARVAFLTRGDHLSSAKALREFAAIQFESGEMPAMHPDSVYFHFLDFAMQYPSWVKEHYLFSGNRELISELLPTLRRLLDYFREFRAPDQEVLFIDDAASESECYFDYSRFDHSGISTALNALYAKSLDDAASIFAAVSPHPQEAETYRLRATTIRRTISQLCWDHDARRFADNWNADGLAKSNAWQTQIMALYGDVCSSEQKQILLDTLFTDTAPFENYISNTYSTPYFRYFVWEALVTTGQRKLAYDIIRNYWGGMLRYPITSWPELYNPLNNKSPFGGCMAMGNSASPAIFIMREIAGVMPVDPGYKTVYFTPAIDLLDSFKAHIPAPNGNINVIWCKDAEDGPTLRFECSQPMQIIPALPDMAGAEIKLHISPTVTIIQE